MQVAGLNIPGTMTTLAQYHRDKIQSLLQQQINEAKADPAQRIKQLFAPSPYSLLFDVRV